LAGRAAEVAVDYTLNRHHLAKADRRFQLVRDKLSRMLSDVVRMVPGGRTDSRRPRRCRLRRQGPDVAPGPGGGLTQSAPGRPQSPLAKCRRSGCPAGGVRRFHGASSLRCPGSRQRTEMFELVSSRSRDATRRALPPETGLTRPVVRTRQIATLPGPWVSTRTFATAAGDLHLKVG
jgi:hypothetical protein